MIRTLHQHFEEIVGGGLLVVMCLIGAVKVVSRYVLTSPIAWTEELATMLFAWLVFIGASVALKKNEHFAIDVVVKLLPTSMGKYSLRARHFAVAAFCLLLIGYGTRLAVLSWRVPTPMLEISRGWFYLSVPFGGLLMLVRTVEMIRRDWQTNVSLPGEGVE
jgi:TRAP-type C4-dicarboxylate transport system permease small subunit